MGTKTGKAMVATAEAETHSGRPRRPTRQHPEEVQSVVLAHTAIPSPFGVVTVAWETDTSSRPLVRRIYLPSDPRPLAPSLGSTLRDTEPPATVADLINRLGRYLAGEVVTFDLDPLDLSSCSAFQQRVLRAEFAIPRGEVSTYGLLAAHIGAPRAARAVGSALARNPFPVVIPCHRAVHADGTLGGFRGGLAMKRSLLEMEGVAFGPDGAVRVARFWYGAGAEAPSPGL